MKTFEEIKAKSAKKVEGRINKSERGFKEKEKETVIVTTLPRYKAGKIIINEELVDKLKG